MIRLLLSFALISLIASCNTPKKILRQRAGADGFCAETLCDLLQRLERKPEGVFHFKMKAKIENLLAWHAEHQKIFQNVFIELNNYHPDCLARFSREDILLLFGQATRITIKGKNLQYVLDFGPNCPCIECKESERYSDCYYFEFIFNVEEKLTMVGGAF